MQPQQQQKRREQDLKYAPTQTAAMPRPQALACHTEARRTEEKLN